MAGPAEHRFQLWRPSWPQDQKGTTLLLLCGDPAMTEDSGREGALRLCCWILFAFLPQHPSSSGNHKLPSWILVTEWWSWACACSWAKSIKVIMNTKQNLKNGEIAAIDISGSHLLWGQAEVCGFTWRSPLRRMMAAMMSICICDASISILLYSI